MELTLKGKCLHALDARDKGDIRYHLLIHALSTKLGVMPQSVDQEINRIAHSN